MASIKLKRACSRNSYQKCECSAEIVIEELKGKMSRLKFRLLDCQNQNQMLRKELLLAKKVIRTEITKAPDEKFQDLLNQTDFRGRQEKILILKDKLKELQNRIKELEDCNIEKSPEDLTKPSTAENVEEHKRFQNRKMMDKELQYLLDNSCQLKRKLEVWKKRNAELNKEAELLRLELERLLEKSKEDKCVHESYLVVDKELRARQAEKLEMKKKLDLEETRNEQLTEELETLKEDVSIIISKIDDDKVLLDALKSQQGHLVDLLDRQKLITENDNRKFQDDMTEIQAKHTTNNHVLDHLNDIVERKTKVCQQVQETMKDELQVTVDERDEHGSSLTITTISDTTSQNESEHSSIPYNELSSETEEAVAENEIMKMTEEVEQQRNLYQSMEEEIEQLTKIVLTNNNKRIEWTAQLLQTNSLLAQKNAEIRDLEETVEKLQKSLDTKESSFAPLGLNFTKEIQKKYEVLQEEHQFLLALWDLLISHKENSLEVYLLSIGFTRKQFTEAIFNFISEVDNLSIDNETAHSEDLS